MDSAFPILENKQLTGNRHFLTSPTREVCFSYGVVIGQLDIIQHSSVISDEFW